MANKGNDESLADFLNKIFEGKAGASVDPDPKDVEGFDQFMKRYTKGLAIEKSAVENLL
jgi:hypothetical protein